MWSAFEMNISGTNTHKLGISGEMDQFLERHKLPELTLEEIENLNTPITRDWMSHQNTILKKSLGSDGFIGDFRQTFK